MPAASSEPRLARIAALLADASRARMLSYLLGGELASAGELADAASVSPSTASGHLAQLLDGGLLACEPRGRHRYYRLADADVAHALEALALVAERGTHERTWSTPARTRLRYARCCYGHLAGQLGVAVLRSALDREWLAPMEAGLAVTERGAAGLDRIGLDGSAWRRRCTHGGRGHAYACLDWSERRDHLAGALGSALLTRFLEAGWLHRPAGDRALELTPPGRIALQAWMSALP